MSRKKKKLRRTRRRPQPGSMVPFREVFPGPGLAGPERAAILPSPFCLPAAQDERIRAVFDLPAQAPWPQPTPENLERYHRFLLARLVLPLQAWLPDEDGDSTIAAVMTGLAPVEEGDASDGLIGEVIASGDPYFVPLVDIAVRSFGPNRELVEDYRVWLGPATTVAASVRSENKEAADVEKTLTPASARSMLVFLGGIIFLGAIYGAVLNVGLAIDALASTGMKTGSIVLGLLGIVAAAQGRMIYALGEASCPATVFRAVIEMLIGMTVGAMLGMMASVWPGAYVGGLLGAALGRCLAEFEAVPTMMLWGLFGAGSGVLVQAWRQDVASFWPLLLRGAAWGALAGPLFGVMVGGLHGIDLKRSE